MTTRHLSILTAVTLLAALAAGVVPAGAATSVSPARDFAPGQVVVRFDGQRFGRAIGLPPGVGVRRAAAVLRQNPSVAYAVPNYIATASASTQPSIFLPDDTGTPSTAGLPGNWVFKQWNFLPPEGVATPELPTSPGGIDAVGAWQNLIAAGHPGGNGVTVAVLDTGIAYRALGKRAKGRGARVRPSPDFSPKQFVPGYNFVGNNRLPVDENGHGTHVAGTIAERTDNGLGVTGIAYGARLMPVQVLNTFGRGQATTIAKGIRFAVNHGAQVINMSFNFSCGKSVPDVDQALRYAYSRGVVLVASAGNRGSESCVSPPASEPHVIGVGGTTEGGCLGSYSLAGDDIDVVAPGGGASMPGCPSVATSPIYQLTFEPKSTRKFGFPGNYVGTSMAAAHVSGIAAMVIASGVLQDVSTRSLNNRVTQRIRAAARDIGLPATEQGAGLVDAARATDPKFK